jgi:hypothetical protein
MDPVFKNRRFQRLGCDAPAAENFLAAVRPKDSATMNFLIRLIGFTAVGVTMLAIALGRLQPPESHLWVRDAPEWVSVKPACTSNEMHQSVWLDIRTGGLRTLKLAEGEMLDTASCSPWKDQEGGVQVAGRYISRLGGQDHGVPREFGLGRYRFPEGEMVDQVVTDVVPVEVPCWDPESRTRIIFPAANAHLYMFDFARGRDPDAPVDSPAWRQARPRRLEWRSVPPGGKTVAIDDPCWPTEPRLNDCLIVTLRYQRATAPRRFTAYHLWWLKLDESRTRIEAAGPLFQSANDERESVEERFPTVATLPDGRVALTYLSRGRREANWHLRGALLEVDSERETPIARAPLPEPFANDCLPNPPAFSPDGQQIIAVRRANQGQARVLRVSTGTGFPSIGKPIAQATNDGRPH